MENETIYEYARRLAYESGSVISICMTPDGQLKIRAGNKISDFTMLSSHADPPTIKGFIKDTVRRAAEK